MQIEYLMFESQNTFQFSYKRNCTFTLTFELVRCLKAALKKAGICIVKICPNLQMKKRTGGIEIEQVVLTSQQSVHKLLSVVACAKADYVLKSAKMLLEFYCGAKSSLPLTWKVGTLFSQAPCRSHSVMRGEYQVMDFGQMETPGQKQTGPLDYMSEAAISNVLFREVSDVLELVFVKLQLGSDELMALSRGNTENTQDCFHRELLVRKSQSAGVSVVSSISEDWEKGMCLKQNLLSSGKKPSLHLNCSDPNLRSTCSIKVLCVALEATFKHISKSQRPQSSLAVSEVVVVVVEKKSIRNESCIQMRKKYHKSSLTKMLKYSRSRAKKIKLFKKALGLIKIILNAIFLTVLFLMLQPVPTHCYTTEEIIKLQKEKENKDDKSAPCPSEILTHSVLLSTPLLCRALFQSPCLSFFFTAKQARGLSVVTEGDGNANTAVSSRAGWGKAVCCVCPADVKSVKEIAQFLR
ncbi:hypothetical protein EK904_000053 [Melospiza melodia maxima]|nr:hypothetical protein EK904_000053 [Melospiza melodia maxima]